MAFTGVATPTIRESVTSTTPMPFGTMVTLPLVSVAVIVLPLKFKLSTVTSVKPANTVAVLPKDTSVEPIVTLELAN